VGASPGDRILVGFIGIGGHGKNRLTEFLQHDDVEVAAVCDVDRDHLDGAVSIVRSEQGNRPRAFGDFRHLLELSEIDAVAIITPDHWHAILTVESCRAGKDVFVEKPLSYSVREGRAMVTAAETNRCVTQMGNHIHNDLPNYRRVVEVVRSGALGRINRVNCWKTSRKNNLGNPPDTEPPAALDYEMWLGPAPKRAYNPLRSHETFRYFWDYSGGEFIDFWCHITDVAYWAMGLDAPRSVSATGGRFFLTDATETPDTLEAVLEFPELNFVFTYHPDPPPRLEHMGGIGCVFQGSQATLVTNYDRHEVYVDGQLVEDFPRPAPSIEDSPGHIREFLDAVKTRDLETTCNIAYGHKVTKAGLLANIAFRTGEKIQWDDEKEQIAGNSKASRLLGRTFRTPWSL
jgi:predicted dehydrogenase